MTACLNSACDQVRLAQSGGRKARTQLLREAISAFDENSVEPASFPDLETIVCCARTEQQLCMLLAGENDQERLKLCAQATKQLEQAEKALCAFGTRYQLFSPEVHTPALQLLEELRLLMSW